MSYNQRQLQELEKIRDLPSDVQDVLVVNSRMVKRIAILEKEVEEKNNIISQLKQSIDESTIEQTQQRISVARGIEVEVEQKTQEVVYGSCRSKLNTGRLPWRCKEKSKG